MLQFGANGDFTLGTFLLTDHAKYYSMWTFKMHVYIIRRRALDSFPVAFASRIHGWQLKRN